MAAQIMSHLSRENNKLLVKQRDGDDKTFSDSSNFELDMDLYKEIKFSSKKGCTDWIFNDY